MSINSLKIRELFHAQLQDWELAGKNYEALQHVEVKEFGDQKVQFNPARIVSSGAKMDEKSIRERKCFLCETNRPKEQKYLLYNDYQILVNPFPVFPEHFTISVAEHAEQLIYSRFPDMLDLAKLLDEYVLFYNGPKCGASAPDHAHFQAGIKGFLPIENVVFNQDGMKPVQTLGHTILLQSSDRETMVSLFDKLYNSLKINEKEKEPMMNMLVWYEEKRWVAAVFPRKKHRPDCYYAEGEGNILISPAAVDLGGVFITPLQKDFEKITAEDIARIMAEVCYNESEIRELGHKICMKD
ncbi:MAG: DUF4922 domain-containing protein [Tannerella sp.]|jgi:ATP adenylyltransferase/5',5'''-P-1,P-4-tetraphosphate phosphorylase II|nr:DUF4922 domain-containing protein [Tannerella sp.]